MTVCGEKVTGVCVMGKCPHFKRCCPVVWDKYGKVKPKTNEEWLKSMNTEQFAEALAWIEDRGELPTVRKENVKAFEKWLKEIHESVSNCNE